MFASPRVFGRPTSPQSESRPAPAWISARRGRDLASASEPRASVAPIRAAEFEGWLSELGLEPIDRGERDGVHSWDLRLDSQRRGDIRCTLILEPASALLCWLHFAPPLNDSFRVSYRQFLRWNDELPFVKFALSADERPVLSSELPVGSLNRDSLGIAICRLLAVCDLTLDRSVKWLWPGAKSAPPLGRPSRQAGLFERYAEELTELFDPDGNAAEPDSAAPASAAHRDDAAGGD